MVGNTDRPVPHYSETKVDVVTTWESDDPNQELVTRYLNVRCPECGRMLFCLRWLATGYPEVHCPPCGFRDHWPFDSHPEWLAFYDNGFDPHRPDSGRAKGGDADV